MQARSTCLHFKNDALFVTTPWYSVAAGTIHINDAPVRAVWTRNSEGRPTCRQGQWQLTAIEDQGGAFSLEIANTGDASVRLHTVHFARWDPGAFTPPLNACDFRELVFGSLQGAGAGVKPVGRKAPFLDHISPSSVFTVYQQEDGAALLLGIIPPVSQAFTECITRHAQPHLEGAFGFEIRHTFESTVAPGDARRTAPVIALSGPSGAGLMSGYGARWRDLLDRKPSRKPMTGWNSWDYYSGAVTRQALDENIAAGKALFGNTLRVFGIDEGWERQWGRWEPNDKFGDLADFCRHVKSEGAMPGIWTAPLLVNTYTPLFLEKPEWFAGRADGQLQTDTYAYGPMAYLDVTQPEVLDFVKGIFRRLKETGFEYFKVDFCHCILRADRFRDPAVGRNALIRRAFQAIREGIGDDAYLLSCGSPYESVVGLADAVRTTGDIHIYWGHVLRNAGSLAVKWWMQGNLWNCDPDFLVVRGPDTAEPPYGRRRLIAPLGLEAGWLAGREFNEMEARTYALLVHLAGGDVFLGDALAKLKPNAVDILRRVLVPRANPAVPVDLFTSEQDLPRIWISRGKTDTLVGLFNWSDKTTRIDFDPDAYGLSGMTVDFWTDAPVVEIPVRMPRRSSVALKFTPTGPMATA